MDRFNTGYLHGSKRILLTTVTARMYIEVYRVALTILYIQLNNRFQDSDSEDQSAAKY
jgi:hypothetical protein